MKRISLAVLLFFMISFMSYGQAPDWEVTNNSLSENMTMIGILQIDGEFLIDTEDVVGAFVGDEVRGVASPSEENASGNSLFYLIIQGDLNPDIITFKIYDASSNTITDAVTTVLFVSDSQIGTAADPIITTENYLPTDITVSSELVRENQIQGILIGTLSTSDEDVDDTHNYILVDGIEDNSSFTLSGDQLFASVTFDFETKSAFGVTILVTDSKGASYQEVVAIAVEDANDAPSDIVLEISSFEENQDVGVVISNLIALDDDTTDLYTFSITGDGPDDDKFIIENGQLVSNAMFDAEETPTVDVSVLADEVDGEFEIQKLITLTILSINDAPILSDTTFYSSEDALISSVIGFVVATDQDADQSLFYEVLFDTPDEQLNFPFDLNPTTGALSLTDELSFEETPTYIFNVSVTDDGDGRLSDIGEVTIELGDAIEAVLPANNYISPNNDGINDVFFIENVSLYQEYTLIIFDQYGSVVLEQEQYQNDWNGSDSSGRELAAGVYYFSMIRSGAPYKYKGSITLFRE